MNNKYKKIRTIILLITITLVVLGIIVSVIAKMRVDDYRDDLKHQLELANVNTVVKSEKTFTALGTILGASFSLFFYIFALVYLFSKSVKIQGRKWPYITMITLSTIVVLLRIFTFATVYAKSQPTPLENNLNTEANRLIVEHVWSTYKSSIVIMSVVEIALAIAAIGLHIAQLVLIKKAKDSSDIEYSKEIVAAAQAKQKQNDLP